MESRASSSSSSQSSETMRADDKMIARNAEVVIGEIRQELMREVENSFKSIDYDAIRQECLEATKQSLVKARLEQNSRIVKELEELQNQKIALLARQKRKLNDELNTTIKEVTLHRMAGEWREVAEESIEKDAEELELELWSEMSSTLQEVYRCHRNTAATVKIGKQSSVDIIDNRLSSLLFQMQANNSMRLRYLTKATSDFLDNETRDRISTIKAEVGMETKTLQRELEQLHINAEQNRATSQSVCILL